MAVKKHANRIPNIFFKSLLRQPIKLIILVVLIAATTFAITLRVTEFFIVQNEITRIEGHFRSIGFLTPVGSSDEHWLHTPLDFTDDTWQDLIENDETVAFVDRRLIYRFFFTDIMNTFIEGQGLPAIFTASLLEETSHWQFEGNMESAPMPGVTDYLIKHLVSVDVFAAHPEHLLPGQEMKLLVPLSVSDDLQTYGMEVGNTYLLRTIFDSSTFRSVVHGNRDVRSIPTKDCTPVLLLVPLYRGGDVYFWDTADAGFDYALYSLLPEIEMAREFHTFMSLRTTVDGSASYPNQGFHGYRLLDGRWTNYSDYINENHVAVIHYVFARMRGLSIGDTLRIAPTMGNDEQALSLEIVGLYDRNNRGNDPPASSIGGGDIFVPASLPLYGFTFMDSITSTPDDSLFSFVLNSPGDQDSFIRDMAPTLRNMGYELAFIPTSFDNFISVADPIRQTLVLNIVLFSISNAAALLLIAFIYMRISHKNFALQRALGTPKKVIMRKLVLPIIAFMLPAIAISTALARLYAVSTAEATLARLQVLEEPYLMHDGGITMFNPVWLAGGIAVVTIIVVCAFGYYLSKKTILRLLQQIGKS